MPEGSRLAENAKAIGFVACFLIMMYVIWSPAFDNSIASAHLMTSRAAHPSGKVISILFIGDNYTSANDMPAMLIHIAASDPSNTTVVQVQSVTHDGVNLLALWNEGVATFFLASRRWTYVVLQEQGEWAMRPDTVKATYDGASKFVYAIKRSGAIPLLYETWQRQPGSPSYKDPTMTFLKNPHFMKEMLHYHTTNLANRLNIGMVPAGAAWGVLLDNNPAYSLYQPDGVNPSVAGTYLVAMVFYHTLIQREIEHVSYVPSGMTAQDAAYVRSFVATYNDAP